MARTRVEAVYEYRCEKCGREEWWSEPLGGPGTGYAVIHAESGCSGRLYLVGVRRPPKVGALPSVTIPRWGRPFLRVAELDAR